MKIIIPDIKIPIEKDTQDYYKQYLIKKLLISNNFKFSFKILKKSLDARNKKQFFYNITFLIIISNKYKNKKNYQIYTPKKEKIYFIHSKTKKISPIIIGFGPAGIFAALNFLKYGIKPIIFEQGKPIEQRNKDIENFIKNKELNVNSNIQFGEGGAGAYSDGKLVTRVKENDYIDQVLKTFVKFGASKEILYKNKPHIGTDIIQKIVYNIRNYILKQGAEIFFNAKMTNLIFSKSKLIGIEINNNEKHYSSTILLAIGHSSRETFEILQKNNIHLEQKAFAIGTRIEHPKEEIQYMQYGNKYKNDSRLKTAEYMLTFNNKKTNRGVFSFCMCPGGYIINASSEKECLTINGMSYSNRSNDFSNSAIVVTINTRDFNSSNSLAGIELQRFIEKKFFTNSGSNWTMPGQNLKDFLNSTQSKKLNNNSYQMPLISKNLIEIFPKYISTELLNAFKYWSQKIPLFISNKAILIGCETRTSSAVRITRNKTRESINTKSLYPIGEGSGYSGGITSSAIDAIKTVETILNPN